ncbi:MAG TPA: cation transporter [Deltaproteobacteria bacterium]|nr:MAG: cation transporter [Deltaproteobacteria bacterium GWA2_55_82]OGQ63447.1 MAG: cation transporter [Deltaproteobacteria bacterium RIFCSPLOWO2_02_FULL_55_12]OIJ74828.1 MAG: cation transporter [Deltaproteobacteria bacterium GWC2_55_46]HBG47526.1 cation transporter [Deltaproteobacteria bacterium]HCY11542.1 cation transporter [Deltaproteobacteria bacterium]
MADCCDDKACEIEALRGRQGSVLKAVLAINVVMFLAESAAGLIAASTALLADSLDMLGDSLVYGFSLYVIGRGARWQGVSALLKGAIMAGFGLFVLGEAAYKALYPVLPSAVIIGWVGALALFANTVCLGLLWRHRSDDINMHSVWLCSRNDIIANVSVIATAPAVWLSGSRWPDIIVGVLIAFIFLRSSIFVTFRAVRHLNDKSVKHEG